LLGAAALTLAPAAPKSWTDALANRARAGGLGLSYDVEKNASDFDRSHANCAYTYDNAAAGLALLAAGRVAEARALGDALEQAQTRDRFWTDGRLRNAYAAGPPPAAGPYPLPGWWDAAANRWVEDAYQVGTATGVVAWAMLLWLALHRSTGVATYHAAAARAGDWVERMTRVSRGYSGGFLGWEPTPVRLGWVSTEHNLDLAVAFAALGRAKAAEHARAFVGDMWEHSEQRFLIGLRPDGSPNDGAAADANFWPLLLPDPLPEWRGALAWAMAHQGVPAQKPVGVGFNDDRDGIWLEGTAYAALAARFAGDEDFYGRAMATLRGQTTADGLVWATTVPRLSTGLATGLGNEPDFYYYRRPSLAATAWAQLAALGISPFR
jgi:hypothetical protein